MASSNLLETDNLLEADFSAGLPLLVAAFSIQGACLLLVSHWRTFHACFYVYVLQQMIGGGGHIMLFVRNNGLPENVPVPDALPPNQSPLCRMFRFSIAA
jgi:hypothetical protein